MIKLLIWSKDRACQLELLLRSINTHGPDTFDVSILYTASNSEFDQGYSKLQSMNYPVRWIREYNLQEQTRKYITDTPPKDPISFSTDDMVFFKKVGVPYIPKYDNEVFSFRLGLNTLMQDCHTGRYQRPLYNPLVEGDIVSWNSNDYHPFDNYGYPLALDTHVFQAAKIQELISYFDFKNTNQLESNMQQYTVTINRMYSFRDSVAVNIPMNNMSTITRAGEKHSYTLEYLNQAFLDGKIIDLGHLAQQSFVGCHQEAELRLV